MSDSSSNVEVDDNTLTEGKLEKGDHLLLIELKNQVSELTQTVSSLVEIVHQLKIDSQLHVKSNGSIPAGMSPKIAYDSNGLVTGGYQLDISDIPELPIDKIKTLKNSLDNIISEDDLEKAKKELSNKMIKKGEVVNTGTKVNYDINGLIVSSSDLLIADIPILPVTKIYGLEDTLTQLKEGYQNLSITLNKEEDNTSTIPAGTYTKITYDKNGNATAGNSLSINDIPSELISRINDVESRLTSFAPSSIVDALKKSIDGKLDSNIITTPGIYTKIQVDKKGLVISGSTLDISDLPELNISNITGLDEKLRNTISIEQFNILNDTVSTLLNSADKIKDVSSLESRLDHFVTDTELGLIKYDIQDLNKLVTSLNENCVQVDAINDVIDQINLNLSTLEGKITSLENKVYHTLVISKYTEIDSI
jgi:hypothetical protein